MDGSSLFLFHLIDLSIERRRSCINVLRFIIKKMKVIVIRTNPFHLHCDPLSFRLLSSSWNHHRCPFDFHSSSFWHPSLLLWLLIVMLWTHSSTREAVDSRSVEQTQEQQYNHHRHRQPRYIQWI
jgi:hypothetical protein